jgi:hypothetical protein
LQNIQEELKYRTTDRAARLRRSLHEKIKWGDGTVAHAEKEPGRFPLEGTRTPIGELDLSVRAANVCSALGLQTVEDLAEKTAAELLLQRNCGVTTVRELEGRLSERGLALRSDLPTQSHPAPGRPESLCVELRMLPLSARARTYLKNENIKFAGELCQRTWAEVLGNQNVGRKTATELHQALQSLELGFGSAIGNWTRGLAESGSVSPELPASVVPLEPDDLLEALSDRLCRAGASDRNIAWTLEHFGWDGGGTRTLESIGQREGVSRERVRQVAAKTCNAMVERFGPPRALTRAIEIATAQIPCTQTHLDEALRKASLVKDAFHVSGLQVAAETFGLDFPVEAHDFAGQTFIVPPETKIRSDVLKRARKLTGTRGCLLPEALIYECKGWAVLSLEFVEALLDTDPSFRRLTNTPDWWWRPEKAAAGRNRLVNTIKKVMAVAPEISISELREACLRHGRTQHFAPPTVVLKALLQELDFVVTEGLCVTRLDNAIDWSQELSGIERALIGLFAEGERVLTGAELSQRAVAAGINENSINIYKSYSPILWRPDTGFYAIVGAAIEAGTMEALRERQVCTPSKHIDHGWTTDGRFFVANRLGPTSARIGFVTVPSEAAQFINGNFLLREVSGDHIGSVAVRNGTVMGLKKLLRLSGAEADDTLVMIFDPPNHDCVACVGGTELRDRIAGESFSLGDIMGLDDDDAIPMQEEDED